jgi:hypothetical protein
MSAPALEFSGLVANGKLPREVAERVASTIRRMEGKRLVIAIKEQKRKRSNQANAYLWGVVYPPIVAAFRDHGNVVDSEDVHLFCKQHVCKLQKSLVTPDGEVLHLVGSTRIFSTIEFSDYIEAVRAWAVETLGVTIPLPYEEVAS